jgi:hypothetical protein
MYLLEFEYFQLQKTRTSCKELFDLMLVEYIHINSIEADPIFKYLIDINDWVLGNYNEEILNKLEKDIFKIL